MIIHDLDIARPVVGPTEADTPLHVDPNAVLLTGAAGLAVCFQPVARQCGHIAERLRAVQQGQSAHHLIRETAKRRAAAAADIEGRVSGHSLRVGSAQSLVAHGATIVEIQIDGRWSSPQMPGHYARAQLAGQGAVARLRYGSLNIGPGTIQRRIGPRCARVRLSGPRSRGETGAGTVIARKDLYLPLGPGRPSIPGRSTGFVFRDLREIPRNETVPR